MKLKDKSFVNRPLSNEVANALQDMALDEKIMMTMNKIDEWEHATKGKWYVSFSGGKDSTVLAYLAAKYLAGFVVPPHPLRLVFADTGLEYPEIRFFVMKYPDFLKSRFPSLEVELTRIRPDVRFDHVISDYGYPLITKEVSEAIYYARRIRPYDGAEREREHENNCEQASGAPRNRVGWERRELLGTYDQYLSNVRNERKKNEPDAGLEWQGSNWVKLDEVNLQ